MKEQKITIEIDREGRISADAEGFIGDACLRDLEKLLEDLSPGIELVDRKPDQGSVGLTSAQKQQLGKKT